MGSSRGAVIIIEFRGYLTGKTLKDFQKRRTNFWRVVMSFAFLLMIPVFMFMFWGKVVLWKMLCAFLLFPIGAVVFPYFAVKADKNKSVPKRIHISDNILQYASDQFTESRNIEEVKSVWDYGEYYIIIFGKLGQLFPYFVCQKNLLTKGSIDEFEALFAGKIERKAEKKAV